ncbi:D-inositol 3-phosphate glycosyltransferase [Tepidimonas taiwanensis]|uniref:D-inositol 3-phosphate glycosyltransferase n=1 Tax=Tepidimonas taiwanensis TaxID=307486 RepID=A0A554XBZ9_9BURK|nr:D-inositol 3-phosphate glycosyltransferase [Tepidimonas taiwanensis]
MPRTDGASAKPVTPESPVNATVLTPDPDPEVIVFNLKRRYTGVSATVNALVPLQARQWRLAYCGTPLPHGMPGMTLREAIALSRRPPAGRPFRIWHVRRDHEMAAGLWARDVLRLPIRLVFTSAAQHRHGWFPRWLISRMDAVIATTPKAASFVPNTTAVVPHGIDLARFSPPPDKLAAWADSGLPGRYGIGVFGRVRPDKGTDVFVDAMIAALPHLPEVTAVIAGLAQPQHQAYQRELQARIDAAGLHERIRFLGEIPAAEVHRWYQRCLVCVACPRYEPFGLTPFEAAATGCAVICSRTGAFEELVQPGVNGALVDTGDAVGLAQAVRVVLADPVAAVRMGEAARARVVEHFSLEREAAGIGAVYERLFRGD